MSEAKHRRLRAFPRETPLVCLASDENTVRNLAESLERAVDKHSAEKSSLILAGSFCLGLKVRTREIPTLLPRICEHSEAVCIGKSYPELFSEHGHVLIAHNALKALSSHGFDSHSHIL